MNGGRVSSQVLPNTITQPQKPPGNIMIDTQTMILENNSFIDTNTFGLGDGGDINMTAINSLTIKNNSGISVASSTGNTGNAGNLNLTVGQLTLQNKAFLNSSTLGSGQGGNITITANQNISIVGKSLIASSIGDDENTSSSHGGEIHIMAPSLEIKEFSEIQTATYSQTYGDAGKMQLREIKIRKTFGC